MNVALIESIASFERFEEMLRLTGTSIANFQILALDLRLQIHLRNRGISYATTLSCFNNTDHKDIVEFTNGVLARFDAYGDIRDRFGANRVYLFELKHRLGFILNHIACILCILSALVENYDSLSLFSSPKCIDGVPAAARDTDSLTAEVVSAFAHSRGLSHGTWAGEKPKPHAEGQVAASSRSAFGYRLLRMLSIVCRARFVFLADEGYGIVRVANAIRARSARVWSVSLRSGGSSVVQALRQVITGLRTGHFHIQPFQHKKANAIDVQHLATGLNQAMADAFSSLQFRGTALSAVLARACHGLGEASARIVQDVDSNISLLEMLSVRLALAPFGRGGAYAIGELAASRQVRVMLISHGAHPVPADPIHEAELLQLCQGFMLGEFTHVALSNPTQEDHLNYFRGRLPRLRAQTVRTGPLFSSAGREGSARAKSGLGIPADAFTVTHAVTTKTRGVDRFHFLESRDEFIKSLSEVVHAVSTIPGAWLVARVHPGFDLTPEELRSLLPRSDRFLINNHGAFERVLAASDVLVSFSSTTIDEALTHNIPVILFDCWKRYNHLRAPSFERGLRVPVQYVTDPHDLPLALVEIQRAGSPDPRLFDAFRFRENHEADFYSFVAESLGGKS